MDELVFATKRQAAAVTGALGFKTNVPTHTMLDTGKPVAAPENAAAAAQLGLEDAAAAGQLGLEDVRNDPFLSHGLRQSPKMSLQDRGTRLEPGEYDLMADPFMSKFGKEEPTWKKIGAPPLPPKPPHPDEPPIIPYWYRSESNWEQCRFKMAEEFTRINEEFTGEWSYETRAERERKRDKAMNLMARASGDRIGRRYSTRTRQAHVVDIFQDEFFLPGEESWIKPGDLSQFILPTPARWVHLLEYTVDAPYPVNDFASGVFNPRPGRVYQGVIEDYYMVQALQTLGMKPHLVQDVFAGMEFSNPHLGVFILRMYKHAQWMHVVIDDVIPMDAEYTPLCCSSEWFPEWNWPCLIEKAYAKLHGSWEALGGGGHVEEVLADLTGGCASRFGTKDVAPDRLFQYLIQNMPGCIYGCRLNAKECGRRNIPIKTNSAGSIYELTKFDGEPYINVCLNAPTVSVRHLPICQVPSMSGYGLGEGFAWLRMDDFVELFDIIYECRLVNSMTPPPRSWGQPYCQPGWMPGGPWFEQIWAYQGNVYGETAPSFFIDHYDPYPVEIIMEASQTDSRYGNQHLETEEEVSRGVHAPLLIRFYQCGEEVSAVSGGEIFPVHMSGWGHCRDAMCVVKIMQPGKYLAQVSMPYRYHTQRMVWRTYSTRPLNMCVLVDHFTFTTVIPDKPLNAIPFSIVGMPKVDTEVERLPQMYDDEDGKGETFTPTWGVNRYFQEMIYKAQYLREQQERYGLNVTGRFGGRGAVATTKASEIQDIACSIM